MDTKTVSPYHAILFKTIERISRFHRHIHDIQEKHGNTYTAHITELDNCLWIILSKVIKIVEADQEKDDHQRTQDLISTYKHLTKFHGELKHLPRPSHPIEIVRFCRMLQKGLKGDEGKGLDINISVNIGEELSHKIYRKTPVELYKTQLLTQLINTDDVSDIFNNTKEQNLSDVHIAVPRIEARNPCVWASAAHELGHAALKKFYEHTPITNEFYSFLGKNTLSLPDKFKDNDKLLKSHLEEYWCDFFGALAMGWSFWFSQLDTMLFSGLTPQPESISHPPSFLRLMTIKRILRSRISHEDDAWLSLARENESLLLESIRKTTPNIYDNDDYNLANEFFQYATLTLFKRQENNETHISENLRFLVDKFYKYSDSISKHTISSLISHLETGLPIPSLRISSEELKERATSVQEIMLAASIAKSAILPHTVLKNFHDILKSEQSLLKRIEAFTHKIDSAFYEFDLCILRSLQVSEYVEFLSHPKRQSANTTFTETPPSITPDAPYPILTDRQIVNFLRKNKLRIIPLIDEGQIGSTSLDVRLGTSFQVYHPNRSGVIDFTTPETVEEAEHNSFLIDLDLLSSFVLAPGQFILGHTMEYLQMPDNIAAEIEGRSSYARLGIEIHMTAGFVDPGFHGVLTLEIFNAGPNPIKLFPGLRVGQLRFFQCPPPDRPYNRNPHAKYKGMLAHRSSLHSGDYEISIYKKHLTSSRGMESE